MTIGRFFVLVLAMVALMFRLLPPLQAQQRVAFSESKVEVDGRWFMPYTKGEVEKRISGSYKPLFDEMCAIIGSWDLLAPPQGLKVSCYADANALEIYFLPYLFEEGSRVSAGSGPNLRIFANYPLTMFGSPLVEDIFLCPQKSADFYGFPIYRNDRQEVTIVSRKSVPLFLPVSQEEYLKALIAIEEKKAPNTISADSQTALREMESAYQMLLKTDKEAAKEFKQHLDDFRADAKSTADGAGMANMVTVLKKELSLLTASERLKQAWYGGASAMERYHNVSGLVPDGNSENSDALVKPNPALIDASSANRIQLLVISWSVGDGDNADKPRFYKEGREGFDLADDLMSKLYHNQTLWRRILAL